MHVTALGYELARPHQLGGRLMAARGDGGSWRRRESVRDIQDLPKDGGRVAAPEPPLKVLLLEDSCAVTEALRAAPIDILVLDLHLQQGDGFGVLRFIRQQQLCAAAIIFTSYDIPQYRRGAAALGAAEFLHKARDYDQVGNTLRRLAAARAHGGTSGA